MRLGSLESALLLSLAFIVIAIWQTSTTLIALHGKEAVAQISPIGWLFSTSRSRGRPSRRALRWNALVFALVPLALGLVMPPPAQIVLVVAALACGVISLSGGWVDEQIRSQTTEQ